MEYLSTCNIRRRLEAELRAKGFGHIIDDEPKDEP
jgi:hypothetical protein